MLRGEKFLCIRSKKKYEQKCNTSEKERKKWAESDWNQQYTYNVAQMMWHDSE